MTLTLPVTNLANLMILFVGCSMAFILHEYGHALVAKMYGLKAVVNLKPPRRFSPKTSEGLEVMCISSVEITGETTPKHEVLIAASGIATNLVQAAFALLGRSSFPSLEVLTILNMGLATINLIPLTTSDGRNIYERSKHVWVFLLSLNLFLWLITLY